MEQMRKTRDLAGRAYDQSPVMSYGTYYAKRSWGTVPVEADGSAYFRVPALREIYFQALDAEGRELQRMTSAVQLMPGERLGCVGCHEPRQTTPPAGTPVPLAARRPPVRPTPPPWGNRGVIGPNPDGGYDLSGDKTRLFNMAYDNLLGRSRSYRQHDMASGEMLPREAARGRPLVHFYWLLRTPTAVNQPLWTGCHASRLPAYFEPSHCGRAIRPEDRRRIYVWIDANVPYYATYANTRPKSPGRRLQAGVRRVPRPLPAPGRPREHLGRPAGVDQLHASGMVARADRAPGQGGRRPGHRHRDWRQRAATVCRHGGPPLRRHARCHPPRPPGHARPSPRGHGGRAFKPARLKGSTTRYRMARYGWLMLGPDSRGQRPRSMRRFAAARRLEAIREIPDERGMK